MMMASERRNKQVTFLRVAASMISFALAMLVWQSTLISTVFALWVFFIGFNFIEATLPSLLSRRIDLEVRGTAMGVFATCQFLGAAVGGFAGGALYERWSLMGLVALGLAAQILWTAFLLMIGNQTSQKNEPNVA